MVNLKEQVGIKAAEFVKDGMIVGLGTGSTAYYFVAEWVVASKKKACRSQLYNVECDL